MTELSITSASKTESVKEEASVMNDAAIGLQGASTIT
jgi:hypothetical protein